MTILDCESVDSAYASIERILGIDRSKLEIVFNDIDLESIYQNDLHPDIPPDQYLFREVERITGSKGEYDQTCWFHLTRTADENTFRSGILPLGHQIDAIWQILYSLTDTQITRKQWDEFRTNICESGGHHSKLYALKVEDPMAWGPYAILVKEIAFRAKEVGAHDYFRVPEIVEDICVCFNEAFGFSLLEVFRSSTRPCIVKFTAPSRNDCLRKALFYLYHVHRKDKIVLDCSTCFNGKAIPVPAGSVLEVEFPDYP
jgi:hypothetical protein